MSTAEIQDATPAVQIAHISDRDCKGPVATTESCTSEALENGGPGSISEQLLDTRPDVAFGGGAKYFDETATAGKYQGKTVLEQAKDRGFNVVDNLEGLNSVKTADQDEPVLGLFADGNFPVRWIGPEATSTGGSEAPSRCELNPERKATQPALADMTTKAIDLLSSKSKGKKHGKGFFLQVEGASIDKRDHSADACGQIGETIDLDEAVTAALDFAKKDGNTTVIVTADHAHTSQIVEAGGNTPGLTTTLLTNEGSPMTLSYGTAPKGGSQQHTGSQLRIAGYGPQAANVVGLSDQTDLFFTIVRALDLEAGNS